MALLINRSTVFILLFLLICGTLKGSVFGELNSDRAIYSPGITVEFTIEVLEIPADNLIHIHYYHLGEVIDDSSLYVAQTGKLVWNWEAPDSDYYGYLVSLTASGSNNTEYHTSIGVDVSSNWHRFPRYGFVSDFSLLAQSEINKVLKNLNRHHINAIQYYDWHYKHHLPVKGNPNNPN